MDAEHARANTRILKSCIELSRLPLSIAVAFTALCGTFIASGSISAVLPLVFAGVFFLSASASALNQIQERGFDSLMDRTKNRPLPGKRIERKDAFVFALAAGILGFDILFFATPYAAILGAANLIWYNCVYTPLKRKSGYALFVGAITGAVPPLIGWAATGESLANPSIILICIFMYFWQIPHFILLYHKLGKEYKTAGFPPLVKNQGDTKIRNLVLLSICATCLVSLSFPAFNVVRNTILIAALVIVNASGILYYRITLSKKRTDCDVERAIRSFYLYQFLVLFIAILDASAL
jgi:heme o synthase